MDPIDVSVGKVATSRYRESRAVTPYGSESCEQCTDSLPSVYPMQVSRQDVATVYGRAEWIAMHSFIMTISYLWFDEAMRTQAVGAALSTSTSLKDLFRH